MNLRKLLLRIMLWSLGIAAVSGVMAILLGGWNVPGRVIGTGVALAVACALMLPTSGMIDRSKTRAAGLLGMAAIILEFLFTVTAIWELPRQLFGRSYEVSLAITMVCFAVSAGIAMYLLSYIGGPRGVIACRTGLVVDIAAFITAMVAAWPPGRYRSYAEWWQTAAALAAMGTLATAALVNVGMGDRRYWRWIGVVAGVVAAALWIADAWIGRGSDIGMITFCLSVSMAAVVAHANLSMLCPLRLGQTWLRFGTIGALMLTAALVDLLVIREEVFRTRLYSSTIGRGAAASGIIASCGTLAMLVLAQLNRKVDYEHREGGIDLLEMHVVCPRCGKKQVVPIGEGTCGACKLRIHIRVEEPRCPQCDYLLYRLTSDRCPECGTSVQEAARGAAVSTNLPSVEAPSTT